MSKVESLEEKVERLENELKAYRSETTTARSYVALKKFIDENNKLLSIIQLTKINLADKDDKLSERSNKYSAEILKHLKNLKEIEAMTRKDLIEEVEKESTGILEDIINEKK